VHPSSVSSLLQWSQLLLLLLTVLTALLPILAKTSGSDKLYEPEAISPLGVAGDLGDRPRADTLRPGDARGDGDVDVRGDDRVGVRGEGVLLREPGPELETVNRLVGRLGLGELSAGVARPRVAGDLDRVLGLPGTDSVVRGDAALEREVFLGDEGRDWVPRCREMGEPGTVRWWQQSSSSLSSLLFLYPSVCSFLTRFVSSPIPRSFSPLKLLFIFGEFNLAVPITGLFGAEFVLDILTFLLWLVLFRCQLHLSDGCVQY